MTTNAATAVVPAHVPDDLRWDHNIDIFPAQFSDPYVDACDAVHQGPDVVWATQGAYCGRPGWMLTRFAHIQEVQLDFRRFSPSLNRDATSLLGIEVPLLPAESDPPMHRYYRQLVEPWFRPGAIGTLEPMIRATCDELMAAFETRDGCEFVGEFSSLFPSNIFLALMGLPKALLPRFLAWENAFLRGPNLEVRLGAMRAIYDYFQALLEERRKFPRDDLLTAIANGQCDGRDLTDGEKIGTCITLYIGGLDSVASGLGWYLRHLALNPELQERLRSDPGLIPRAIEELSRAYATNCTMRTVMQDTDFHGAPMRKGDIVALATFWSARDGREYPTPHLIDIDRKSRSMTFGAGAHHCLGIHLAKREIKLVLSEFLSRFRNIRIRAGESAAWTTTTIWGVKRLPLMWDKGEG